MSENYLGIMTRIMSELWHRKLSPSILSGQKVMTYRNTSYLKKCFIVLRSRALLSISALSGRGGDMLMLTNSFDFLK